MGKLYHFDRKLSPPWEHAFPFEVLDQLSDLYLKCRPDRDSLDEKVFEGVFPDIVSFHKTFNLTGRVLSITINMHWGSVTVDYPRILDGQMGERLNLPLYISSTKYLEQEEIESVAEAVRLSIERARA